MTKNLTTPTIKLSRSESLHQTYKLALPARGESYIIRKQLALPDVWQCTFVAATPRRNTDRKKRPRLVLAQLAFGRNHQSRKPQPDNNLDQLNSLPEGFYVADLHRRERY